MDEMRRLLGILALFMIAIPARSVLAEGLGNSARVAVAVADLRKEPNPPPADRGHDSLEESQLLYGDAVSVLEEKGDWVRVSAPQQMEYTHANRWEGYPGWVERKVLVPEPEGWNPTALVCVPWAQVRTQPDPQALVALKLSAGTRLMPAPGEPPNGWRQIHLLNGSTGWLRTEELLTLPEQNRLEGKPPLWRERVVEIARQFLGAPYYWGGRSAYDPEAAGPPHLGVDCSGLVGLAYQATGSVIPRDAHEQWMNAWKISREELQPADLVFLFDPNQPDRVNHVMLYRGNHRVIEGPGTGEAVREIDLDQRLKENPARPAAYGRYLPRTHSNP